MSSKRKEYKVDARAKKAALFFLACEPNPVTSLSIPAAMRAKGYTDVEAADQILVQQVRRESPKNKSNDTPHPESAAALSLLALGPGNGGISGEQQAGAPNNHAKSNCCSRSLAEMPSKRRLLWNQFLIPGEQLVRCRTRGSASPTRR